jgi:hypothetical protein
MSNKRERELIVGKLQGLQNDLKDIQARTAETGAKIDDLTSSEIRGHSVSSNPEPTKRVLGDLLKKSMENKPTAPTIDTAPSEQTSEQKQRSKPEVPPQENAPPKPDYCNSPLETTTLTIDKPLKSITFNRIDTRGFADYRYGYSDRNKTPEERQKKFLGMRYYYGFVYDRLYDREIDDRYLRNINLNFDHEKGFKIEMKEGILEHIEPFDGLENLNYFCGVNKGFHNVYRAGLEYDEQSEPLKSPIQLGKIVFKAIKNPPPPKPSESPEESPEYYYFAERIDGWGFKMTRCKIKKVGNHRKIGEILMGEKEMMDYNKGDNVGSSPEENDKRKKVIDSLPEVEYSDRKARIELGWYNRYGALDFQPKSQLYELNDRYKAKIYFIEIDGVEKVKEVRAPVYLFKIEGMTGGKPRKRTQRRKGSRSKRNTRRKAHSKRNNRKK